MILLYRKIEYFFIPFTAPYNDARRTWLIWSAFNGWKRAELVAVGKSDKILRSDITILFF